MVDKSIGFEILLHISSARSLDLFDANCLNINKNISNFAKF